MSHAIKEEINKRKVAGALYFLYFCSDLFIVLCNYAKS